MPSCAHMVQPSFDDVVLLDHVVGHPSAMSAVEEYDSLQLPSPLTVFSASSNYDILAGSISFDSDFDTDFSAGVGGGPLGDRESNVGAVVGNDNPTQWPNQSLVGAVEARQPVTAKTRGSVAIGTAHSAHSLTPDVGFILTDGFGLACNDLLSLIGAGNQQQQQQTSIDLGLGQPSDEHGTSSTNEVDTWQNQIDIDLSAVLDNASSSLAHGHHAASNADLMLFGDSFSLPSLTTTNTDDDENIGTEFVLSNDGSLLQQQQQRVGQILDEEDLGLDFGMGYGGIVGEHQSQSEPHVLEGFESGFLLPSKVDMVVNQRPEGKHQQPQEADFLHQPGHFLGLDMFQGCSAQRSASDLFHNNEEVVAGATTVDRAGDGSARSLQSPRSTGTDRPDSAVFGSGHDIRPSIHLPGDHGDQGDMRESDSHSPPNGTSVADSKAGMSIETSRESDGLRKSMCDSAIDLSGHGMKQGLDTSKPIDAQGMIFDVLGELGLEDEDVDMEIDDSDEDRDVPVTVTVEAKAETVKQDQSLSTATDGTFTNDGVLDEIHDMLNQLQPIATSTPMQTSSSSSSVSPKRTRDTPTDSKTWKRVSENRLNSDSPTTSHSGVQGHQRHRQHHQSQHRRPSDSYRNRNGNFGKQNQRQHHLEQQQQQQQHTLPFGGMPMPMPLMPMQMQMQMPMPFEFASCTPMMPRNCREGQIGIGVQRPLSIFEVAAREGLYGEVSQSLCTVGLSKAEVYPLLLPLTDS
ncbi:hypothetical protein HK102_002587 [Quaeritorhiza haematococci]|nr:hypothetical protein HK102_002587 [Quaeritorhiza haematococci]